MRSTRRTTRIANGRLSSGGALAASGLLALALALACGGGEESTPAPTGDAKASPTTTPIEIPEVATEEPTDAEVTAGELPASFPEDLPVFPDATPTSSMFVPGGNGMIVFSAASPSDEVLAFYTSALTEQGWDVESEGEDGRRLRIKKDDRRATVTIEDAEGGASISVVLSGA